MPKQWIFKIKCWNCHGLGLIPLQNEDDPDQESYAYGDLCPICQGYDVKLVVNYTFSWEEWAFLFSGRNHRNTGGYFRFLWFCWSWHYQYDDRITVRYAKEDAEVSQAHYNLWNTGGDGT